MESSDELGARERRRREDPRERTGARAAAGWGRGHRRLHAEVWAPGLKESTFLRQRGGLDKFGEGLTRNHVPAVGDGQLSPAAHGAKRERYLRLLMEAMRGIPHFQLGTGEELTDDHDHYLVWEPGAHWDRGTWRNLLGEQAALNHRETVTDNLG